MSANLDVNNAIFLCRHCHARQVTKRRATCARCTKMIFQNQIDSEHKESVRRFWMVMLIVATVGVFVAVAASLGGQS